jgi:hypothetical protein
VDNHHILWGPVEKIPRYFVKAGKNRRKTAGFPQDGQKKEPDAALAAPGFQCVEKVFSTH